MNWEETIKYIQGNDSYQDLLDDAYLSRDLVKNVEAFERSAEFDSTLRLVKKYAPNATRVLDIGAGNGISSVAFAKVGFEVVAIEPDPSELVGAGAIRSLQKHYGLSKLTVIEAKGEDELENIGVFDVAFGRQVLHHAQNLTQFVRNLAARLKPNGILLTTRDHIIYDAKDKELFLQSHPLHKFYGGENAFLEEQYLDAFSSADLELLEVLKHYDSVINYSPQKIEEIDTISNAMVIKHAPFTKPYLVKRTIRMIYDLMGWKIFDERYVPGRLRTFLLKKPAI